MKAETPPSNRIHFEMNGQPLEAEPGTMLIEAADAAGIRIPRFCYHKKLSIAANCRMCLVDVEKSPKPVPACATPVTEGMRVSTYSPKALQAQQAVMEFLLINHPLDCPICDQGGECELQDVAMGYGRGDSQYQEPKRAVVDPDLGPLIATEMTRCIHCTRCIRFGTEIAGVRELGAVGRGEHVRITNFVSRVVESELSANVIDVCPVGALTHKPSRFQARPWELEARPGIAAHDRVGSHVMAHTRRGMVYRVVPREAEAVNETWLSDRDRFSYQGLESPDRLLEPMIKEEGVWKTVSWDVALHKAVAGFQAVAAAHGADQNAFLIHPSATLEELYLFQRLARHMGSPHIDSRLQSADDATDIPAFYGPEVQALSLPDWTTVEQSDCIVIVGADVRQEQPLVNTRIRKAAVAGAPVFGISHLGYAWNYPMAGTWKMAPQDILLWVMGVYQALSDPQAAQADFPGVELAELLSTEGQAAAQTIAQALRRAQRPVILTGAYADTWPMASACKTAIRWIRDRLQQQGAKPHILHLPAGANALGAAWAGALPYVSTGGLPIATRGRSTQSLLRQPVKGYFLWHIEPDHDVLEPGVMQTALAQAEWVVLGTPFVTESILEQADVVLPVAPIYETAGTLINATGDWQSFEAWVPARGQSRPGWRILRVLHNLIGYSDIAFMSAFEVRDWIRSEWEKIQHGQQGPSAGAAEPGVDQWPEALRRHVREIPARSLWYAVHRNKPYAADALVRRADALQAMPASQIFKKIRIHPDDAQLHQLQPGEPVQITGAGHVYIGDIEWSTAVPPGGVWIDPEIWRWVPGTPLTLEKMGGLPV